MPAMPIWLKQTWIMFGTKLQGQPLAFLSIRCGPLVPWTFNAEKWKFPVVYPTIINHPHVWHLLIGGIPTPLKSMKVNGKDDIPYITENKHVWNHQPGDMVNLVKNPFKFVWSLGISVYHHCFPNDQPVYYWVDWDDNDPPMLGEWDGDDGGKSHTTLW